MTPTVLVVDDDPAVCRAVTKLLGRQGYRVLHALSADEGLRLLDGALHFDLVLSDQVMPGMTGTEFLDRVRSRWPAMPSVLMSGVAPTCSRGVAPPTLMKPFSARELSLCVMRVIQARRS